MKLSEVVGQVIDLSAKIRAYWEAELPKRHPNYPIAYPDEDSGPPPPEEKQLRELFRSLPKDMVYQLLLLMYLGRGDSGAEDLAARYEEIKQSSAKPTWAIDLMMGKASLADYLSDGVEELKNRNIDVDQLPLKRTKARKS